MARRIELPDGGWADIKDRGELSERDRRTIRKAGVGLIDLREQLRAAGLQKPAGELTEDEQERVMALTLASDAISDQEATFVAVYTTAWSYEQPITVESVFDLPGPVFDLLGTETMRLGDGTVDVAVDPDPASPTLPSGGSDAA